MGNSKHLTEEEIAECAEAIINNTFGNIDPKVRQHIEECDLCANEVTTVASILEQESILMADIDSAASINVTKKKTNYKPFLAWSAAAAIIIFIGLKMLSPDLKTQNKQFANTSAIDSTNTRAKINKQQVIKPEIKPQPQVVEKQPKQQEPKTQIIKPDKTKLLAYTPNEQMEKLVDRFNGSAMRGDDIEIITPSKLETTTTNLLLEWTNSNSENLILEFFDNKGNKLYEEETTANNHKPKRLNKNGLYYWKIINEDFDLLFCGKIILE